MSEPNKNEWRGGEGNLPPGCNDSDCEGIKDFDLEEEKEYIRGDMDYDREKSKE